MGDGEGGAGGKPAAPQAQPPKLPPNPPAGLQRWIDCTANGISFKPGRLPFITGTPSVEFEAGEQAGTVNLKLTKGIFSITIPASVNNGQLTLDTSKVPDLSDIWEGVGPKPIDGWVKSLNDWLKANGKQLGPLNLTDKGLAIRKVAAPAPVPAKAAPAVPGTSPGGEKKDEPKKTTGIKAAAGTGAFLLGFGLGSVLSPDDGGVGLAPTDPVPVVQVQVAEPQAEPETREVVSLPPGQVPAQITITGPPGSFDTTAIFEQEGQRLSLIVPSNPPFTGRIDDQGAFSVDNSVGSFDGTIQGDQVEADHTFQGESFTMTGTLTQPTTIETVLEGDMQPDAPPLAGVIRDEVVLQPTSDSGTDGDLLPIGAGVLLGAAGVGLLLLDRTGKRDCAGERAKLETYLKRYRSALADLQRAKGGLEEAEDQTDRVIGEVTEGDALSREERFQEDLREAREALLIEEDNVGDAEDDLAECEGREARFLEEILRQSGDLTAEVM